MTDKKIIKLFINRDEAALGAVMEKYGALCLGIAEKLLPTRDEAEECVNDALIELWHHLAEDRPRDLPAYISETVIRCARGEAQENKSYTKKPHGKVILAVVGLLIILMIPALFLLPQKNTEEDTLPEESTSLPADTTEEATEPIPLEHDGTEGLLYEIAEDGKSARFIGFGDCEEETVYIASTYGTLPVTEMILGELWALANTEGAQINSLTEFGSEHLKHLIISDTVEVVGNEIISSCANIESVYYGKSVRDPGIGWSTGYNTHKNFKSLEVSPENAIYYSSGNCIIEKATKTLVRGCGGSVIPEDGSVEVIGERAFSSVIGLTELNIPDSVKIIENRAFYLCRDLNEITLPEDLQSLGEEAFHFCSALTSVDLNGYAVLPKAAFKHCGSLEELKGSENITEIGEEALADCNKLKLTLGTLLKKIGKYAFLNFPNNITYKGTKAEWNAIEKDVYWVAHSRVAGKLRLIVCTNGGIEITSAQVKN